MAKKKIVKKPKCDVGNFKRFFAYLLDYYLGLLLCSLPIVLANGIINQSEKMQMNLFFFSKQPALFYSMAVVSLLLGYYYYIHIPLKVWKGQTVAKRLFHFKIVKKDGDEVDVKTLVLRYVVGFTIVEGSLISCSSILRQTITYMTNINLVDPLMKIGTYVSLASCMLVFVTKNRQMIHDFIAGTMVTDENYEK